MNKITRSPPEQAPEDFGAGALPSAFWLRSAAFFVAEDHDSGLYSPSVEKICGWLKRFDVWYKATIGIETTARLHLMYHRDITLVGDRFLDHVSEIQAVAEAATNCGIGFSITVPLNEGLEKAPQMMDLINCPAVSTLGVSIDNDCVIEDRKALEQVLRTIVKTKGHIAFIGTFDVIRRLGLLDIEGVDSAQITIHPKNGEMSFVAPMPENPVAPCFSRLRIYSDVDGLLYPCLGLIGVPGTELGSIDDEIDDMVLGKRRYPMRIDCLARKGPDLKRPKFKERLTGLPSVCERHRRELLADLEETETQARS